MATALKTALKVLDDHFSLTDKGLPNIALHERVAEITGQSREVLHGSLNGLGPKTVRGCAEYQGKYHTEKLSSGRLVHKKGAEVPPEFVFTCAEKARTNKRIMLRLLGMEAPRVLTLASREGNCVQALLEVCPDAEIHNIESDEAHLTAWEAKCKAAGIKVETDWLGDFEDFVRAPDFQDTKWDLVNADIMGYPGTKQARMLANVNASKACRFFALTTHYDPDGWFRNRDGWKWNQKYPSGDRKGQFVTDHMSNYTLVDRWNYKGVRKHQAMEVFVFELKEQA